MNKKQGTRVTYYLDSEEVMDLLVYAIEDKYGTYLKKENAKAVIGENPLSLFKGIEFDVTYWCL